MTNREEVIAAIEATQVRVDRLAPAILAHAAARLLGGEWSVRQALCHVAARANSVPLATRLSQRALAAQAQGQDLNFRGSGRAGDINQGQIDERQDRSVPDLLNEIHAGHQAAIAAVRELKQETFDQRFPGFTGAGDMSLAELILRAGSGHENDHLDQIARAMEAAPRAS